MTEELITIPAAHYKKLLEDSDFLSALVAGGVDNWSGYEDATSHLYKEEEED